MKKPSDTMSILLPFSLTAAIITVDQISKGLIQSTLKIGQKIRIIDDFFWLWHVRNKGMAFSLGNTLPEGFRDILFLALPVVVLLFLLFLYFNSQIKNLLGFPFKTLQITSVQKWCFAAILGGGIGNLIDRFLRPEGVIDFISFKFYGILGFERYPTFNVADSSVVIAGIIMVISYLSGQKRSSE
jgi:signal peptidase II